MLSPVLLHGFQFVDGWDSRRFDFFCVVFFFLASSYVGMQWLGLGPAGLHRYVYLCYISNSGKDGPGPSDSGINQPMEPEN
jgi:hypothetical protein